MLRACRICFSTKLRNEVTFEKMPIHLWPSKNGLSLETSQLKSYTCEDCGHLQLQNLSSDFIKNLYTREYMNMDSSLLNLSRANYLKTTCLFESANILDVGGGTNATSQYFPTASYSILDPQRPSDPRVKHIDGFISDAQLEIEVYDYIFAFHILEHLEEPRADLQKLASSLKENGKIVIEVPDSIYYAHKLPHYLYFHQHINLFTAESIDQLFALEGFHKIDSVQNDGRLLFTYTKNLNNYYLSKPIAHSDDDSIFNVNSKFFAKIESNILQSFSKYDFHEVVFLGSGGSTTLLMYHLPGLLKEIDYFLDSDVRKIGLNLPGTNKQILKMSEYSDPRNLYLTLGVGILSNWIGCENTEIMDLLPILENRSH